MVLKIGFSIALASACLVAFADDGYVCMANTSSGFLFDKTRKEWRNATFKATGKYLVSRAKPEDSSAKSVWVVKPLGSKYVQYACGSDFNSAGVLFCDGFGEFKFNRNNMRFLSSYTIGFYSDGLMGSAINEEGANTPMMEIGTCSPL